MKVRMPPIWIGFLFSAWFNLLRKGKFCTSPSLWLRVAFITHSTLLISLFHQIGKRTRARKINSMPVTAPVFIIGHWRSGTTLLHTLMSRDKQFSFPTNAACFAPGCLLFGSSYIRFWQKLIVPQSRPMDGMSLALDEPQEDEFGLIALGAPSTYLNFAFPRQHIMDHHSLDIDTLPPAQKKLWRDIFMFFLRVLTRSDPRTLLLKSPTHTCRIPIILELFPDARFIYIERDPNATLPSTFKATRQMYMASCLQRFTEKEHEIMIQSVLNDYCHMMQRYAATRALIPEGHLVEIKFEELIDSPLKTLEHCYKKLNLKGFEAAKPNFEQHIDSIKAHKVGKWQNDPALQARIDKVLAEIRKCSKA